MLTPDWELVLGRTTELALRYLDDLPERPVFARAGWDAVHAVLDGPVPDDGTDAERVVTELAAAVDPGLTAMGSGRFFGWVIGGALPAALAADWLTAAWDQNAAMLAPTPSAMVVEDVAARWLRELLALPSHASVGFVTGCQLAHVTCLAAARDRLLAAVGWDVATDGLAGSPPLHVLVSAAAHVTVGRALRLLGIGRSAVHVVPADGQGRLSATDLERALAALPEGPTLVCAQVGNVNTGAIDPLPAVNELLVRRRARVGEDAVWLHIDGAFGLWAAASPSLRPGVAGLDAADSWATDAHKWLNVPYDSGIAICAHPDAHRRAMAAHAEYLPDAVGDGGRDAMDWTPEFSRRARGFAVYAAIRQLGRSGVAELVDRCCANARRFAERLGAVPGVTVLNEVVLNQVLVAFADPSGGDDDAHTRAVLERVLDDGTCVTTGSTWDGRACMRISVSNWSTTEADVDRSVAAILRAHRPD